MVKRRQPRKTKKWHKKHGWTASYTTKGTLYYFRQYRIKL